MALVAKANAILKAKRLDEDITVGVGGGELLMVAAAGDWLLWDDDKGFRQFVPAADFDEKWLFVGG